MARTSPWPYLFDTDHPLKDQMSQHTPKPWTYAAVSEGHILGGPRPLPGDKDTRVVVCRDINPDDVPLILAAPALLEALRLCAPHVARRALLCGDFIGQPVTGPQFALRALHKVTNAIHNATGEDIQVGGIGALAVLPTE